MSPRQRHRLLDRLGAYGSIACAIHCALLPVLIALLPSLGVALFAGDALEQAFVVFASLLGLGSLSWSYRRHRALPTCGSTTATCTTPVAPIEPTARSGPVIG